MALAQSQKENVDAVVLFDVEDGLIDRFDLCIPQLYQVVRSGEYPG
ncbi:MAG: hypothetical protein U5K56_15275 [Halioglobus sp.]|nr:hypothetical protein [Halioglobus sp.]